MDAIEQESEIIEEYPAQDSTRPQAVSGLSQVEDAGSLTGIGSGRQGETPSATLGLIFVDPNG